MKYVIGLDYGTDSVRALIVNAENGAEISTAVHYYPRWKKGLYCDPSQSQYRQHPLDYLEGLAVVIKQALKKAGKNVAKNVGDSRRTLRWKTRRSRNIWDSRI